MQSSTRCPRCGYVLTYNGYAYYCSFCGYPQTRETIAGSLRTLERSITHGVKQFLADLKPKIPVPAGYFPVATQPCSNCGFTFPRGIQICPSCGIRRPMLPQDTAPPAMPTPSDVSDLDRRVFDYINAHSGTISISKTVQDLAVTQPILLSSIERLKAAGFLTQS
jgi:ribosomal protein L37E